MNQEHDEAERNQMSDVKAFKLAKFFLCLALVLAVVSGILVMSGFRLAAPLFFMAIYMGILWQDFNVFGAAAKMNRELQDRVAALEQRLPK